MLQRMQLKPITAMAVLLLLVAAAIAVLLLLVASVLLAACTKSTSSKTSQTPSASAKPKTKSEKKTFTSDSRGYTITYPNTWRRSVNSNAEAIVDLTLTVRPNKLNVVTVASVKLNATTGTTRREFTDFNLRALSTKCEAYWLQSFEDTTLAGQQASKIVWQATVPQRIGTVTQNAQIKATQFYVTHDGRGYVVAYKAVTSDYETYLTQAQQVLNSFKFTS